MLASIPVDHLMWLAGALLVAGFATGILAGLFGIGGGAIIVPVLYEVFGAVGVSDSERMHLSVGTALAIIVPTALRSYFAHRARTKIDNSVLKIWAAPLVVGVIAGTALAAVSNDVVLKIAFVAFAVLMSGKLLFGRESWVIADRLPGRLAMSAYAFGIGLASPLIGISGGGIATVVLTLYRVPIHTAIATSAGLGALIAVPGTIGYVISGIPHLPNLPPLSIGYVSLPGLVLVGGVATLAAPLGARLAHAFTKRQLEVGFGLYLLLVGLRFVIALAGF
ncbi:sulfite exporter TauE/SafE family protein [Ancylobacter sp. WKF20]|uniref:sulfite exporter TauE/SafE family protein n=1 Tax=Ancylobacter sp. WKF20 TaxID=3039801 RepID=UPI002434106E|nr:sulfite exporter TauE/SafE family protein [Ancylobacter sp. WKF20]WGD30552.1 sulfite exporter TauE/SafE family protein [Ancylobacter sp. WKF20]